MNADECSRLLKAHGFTVTSEGRMKNDLGDEIRLSNGAKVNFFDTGTIQVQGKAAAKAAVETALYATPAPAAVTTNGSGGPVAVATPQPAFTKVFVVYGHDIGARTQLEAMLRRWGLEPLILDQLPSAGLTIIEKLQSYAYAVNYAVVLATPDDEGHRKDHPDEKTFRARQNVVLELGMLLARLGREKVAILIRDPSKMERPSDIQGLVYLPFSDNLEKEAGVALAKEMIGQGFNISVANL